ncbi:RNA polymerase sigma factor [Streptomyces sp. NPDC059556]|uniref:RNA polymerase sigma factor n=1 Tax=Streptomyces sp. NPDC059556 TaxID=3346863 RepID=UPI0036CA4C27
MSDDTAASDTPQPRAARLICPLCDGDACHHMWDAYDAAQAAITAAYLDYYRPLHAFVTKRATEWGISEAELDREGAVQDTFLAAIRFWHDVREPRAWLFTVAGRLVKRHLARAPHHAFNVLHDAWTYEEEIVGPWWTSAVPQAHPSRSEEHP